jgi:hypothetical protein
MDIQISSVSSSEFALPEVVLTRTDVVSTTTVPKVIPFDIPDEREVPAVE